MLTALELENFKGVASRQRIEFAPLTLLFGANSAGKSTILQALLYLHELLEHGSPDVDRTELGGSVLELGGFARLVHRHELDREIVIRAEFATPGSLYVFSSRDTRDFPFLDLDDEAKSAWVEFTIAVSTSQASAKPTVQKVVVGLGDDRTPLVELRVVKGVSPLEEAGVGVQACINYDHRVIDEAEADVAMDWWPVAVFQRPSLSSGTGRTADESAQVPLEASEDHTEELEPGEYWDDCDPGVFDLVGLGTSALPPLHRNLKVLRRGANDDIRFDDESAQATAHVETFLELVVLGTLSQLARGLRDALYLGPLRAMPSRSLLYQHTTRSEGWADGLAAWERLLGSRSDGVLENTNDWLRRLDANCQVVVQQLFDRRADAEALSVDHADYTVRRLLLDTGAESLVLPSEVGAGVTQVVPVVVAALSGKGMCLIEQPEIHVHPAMQARLGDLFIEALRERRGRPVVVETHSEHLILRLLRRIREASETEAPSQAPAFSADKLSVIYVESDPAGVRIQRLRVGPDGEFLDRWPKGFFEERAEELF